LHKTGIAGSACAAVLACNSDTLAASCWSSEVGHERTSRPEYLHAI